jgi:BirA family biotin operon repressor/biotin-[acetyl-CoA-carboxylase] ligase
MDKNEAIISTIRLSDGSSIKTEYHSALFSTSSLAKEYATKGYPDKYVIIAEKQYDSSILRSKLSQGEAEEGIFVSVLLRPTLFPSQLGVLSPLSATALLSALEEHTENELGIAWLSDIYCNGHRIGGVTREGKLDSFTGFEYMIVSFAVKFSKEHFPPRLTDLIRKVFESGNESVGMIIAKTIVNKFFEVYRDVKSPDKYVSLYRRKFILNGKKIKYLKDGKKRSCRVIDIDSQDFSLLCSDSSGAEVHISSPSQVVIPERIK